MPSVIPSPEVQWLSECHCQCLWDDPACFHPSQPPLAQSSKAWSGWYFKYSITATFEGCREGKICQGAGLCFMCFSAEGKKTCEVDDLLRSGFMCVDVEIGRLLTALPGHTSSYPFLCLMALHQNVQPGVDGTNENVSQPCVPRRPWRASIGRDETRRRHRPMLCCAVSDWWLSVVTLWLGLWWFITTAHNVIRLCVYIHSTNQCCAMIHIFVCFCVGALVGSLHVITLRWLEFYWVLRLAKSRFPLKDESGYYMCMNCVAKGFSSNLMCDDECLWHELNWQYSPSQELCCDQQSKLVWFSRFNFTMTWALSNPTAWNLKVLFASVYLTDTWNCLKGFQIKIKRWKTLHMFKAIFRNDISKYKAKCYT